MGKRSKQIVIWALATVMTTALVGVAAGGPIQRQLQVNGLRNSMSKIKRSLVQPTKPLNTGGDDGLTESVNLNFGEVSVKYTEQTKEGSSGSKPDVKYDINQNKIK